MTSDNNSVNDAFDERIAEVRDSILLDGESIVVQETGDQGQGIILTNSRILIIKVGITATGTANGKIIGTFDINDVSAVNVRKGPLGSVIQIVSENKPAAAESWPPDNVIIFTGPQKIKKCDAIAAKIEKALGKSIDKVEAPKEPESVVTEPIEDTTVETVSEAAIETDNDVAIVVDSDTDDDYSAIINEAVAAVETVETPEDQQVEPEPEVISEPKPEPEPKKRGGRKAISLADEIFAEIMDSGKEKQEPDNEPSSPVDTSPAVEFVQTDNAPSEPVIEEPVAEVVEINETSEPVSIVQEKTTDVPDIQVVEDPAAAQPEKAFKPNPRLPKPVRKKSDGKERILVLLGLLLLSVLVGVAATSPLRVQDKEVVVSINVKDLTNSPSAIRNRYDNITGFQNSINKAIADCDSRLGGFRTTLQSGNKNGVYVGKYTKTVGDAWRKVSNMEAPSGLAEAKSSIVNGLFTIKNAAASASSTSAQETLDQIAQGQKLIQRGLDDINSVKKDLDAEIASKQTRRVNK